MGARGSGKTTLCQNLFPHHPCVNLEDPDEFDFANEGPKEATIDEVHLAPKILPCLLIIIDKDRTPGRWILTGSQNFAFLKSVTQSLAGRTAVFELFACTQGEKISSGVLLPASLDSTRHLGSYPELIISEHIETKEFCSSYIKAYLERNVRSQLEGGQGYISLFRKFMKLCAGKISQMINFTSLASDCGVPQKITMSWMDILESSYIVFFLPVIHTDYRKQLVKNPKLHFYDTGLVCVLLGIETPEDLAIHPKCSRIFETWEVSDVSKTLSHRRKLARIGYYRDSSGSEVDFVVRKSHNNYLLFEGPQKLQNILKKKPSDF